MTEKLPPLLTHSSTPSQAAVLSPQSAPPISNHVSNKTLAPAEEEPYTIKCICDFTDDDGNTIYCELCDTWQHIECYYPYNMVEVHRDDFNHSCVECNPRTLDRQRANERQILRQSNRNRSEASERKTTKRPPPKGQKKKARPTDLGLNSHNAPENNPKQTHDPVHTHQHKKSKSSHRPSQSISSQAAKRSPSYGQKTTNPHGHPPSPATTPSELPHEFEIHNYSSGFMDLYKEDRDVAIVQTNSFASLIISNLLSAWLRDGEKLRQETGCDYGDVFQSLPLNIDAIKSSTQVRSKKLAVGSDTIAHWQYLASSQAVDKNVLLIELNGQIGIQKDYCQDQSNRWQDLSSPLPFVFFHPMLPLYIDTRKEGSQARYVRRSCKPNAILDTYLSEGSEYHFWLVSDRSIRANEQITIPWEFNLQKDVAKRWLQLLGLSDDVDKQPEFNEKETETYHSIAAWVHTILSEYGGCACDLGSECAFARFHRTYIARPQGKEKGSKQKKARKPKTSNVSPTSTGQATNSRAPSEGHAEDGVDNDSASSRSKPPSRDMTPAPRQGSFDTLGVLTELTDRDKRKVQMVEDSFRRMEQQQPPRKKKRTSDGTTSSSTSGTTTKPKSKPVSTNTLVVNNTTESRYVDAGTSGSVGGSPTSAVSPTSINPFKQPVLRNEASLPPRGISQGPRPEYRDVAVQTDPVEGAWFSDDRKTTKPKKRIVSLSKRLLESRYRLRAEDNSRRTSIAASPTSVASALVKMDLDSPITEQADPAAATTPITETANTATAQCVSAVTTASEDTPMEDAPMLSPGNKATPVDGLTPSKAAKVRSPELRVQLPPVPAFNSSSVASSAITPVSANESVIQSPFSASNLHGPSIPPAVNGVAVQPSPVKKKLSLSDYTKSRMNKAKSTVSLKPPTTITEEAKSPISADTVMSESPVNEKGVDP
ncbi:hypothetical protein GQX73_g6287 [Xylaria multiplex]|uniref:SET domain-containing protein n=1 Tax=Xylaria multiplex TaxID=323545 RepID=A0A7C8IMC4_9PEZI|nr:hypothetical protein GQX73_g6287 [Xylaria multiplex]